MHPVVFGLEGPGSWLLECGMVLQSNRSLHVGGDLVCPFPRDVNIGVHLTGNRQRYCTIDEELYLAASYDSIYRRSRPPHCPSQTKIKHRDQ